MGLQQARRTRLQALEQCAGVTDVPDSGDTLTCLEAHLMSRSTLSAFGALWDVASATAHLSEVLSGSDKEVCHSS
jgi:hypothetical protein